MSGSSPIAVITGASRGLGRVLAVALSERGYEVALGARSLEDLRAVQAQVERQGGQVLVHPLDVTSPASIREFHDAVTESCGRADLLINNAGLGFAKPLSEISEQEIALTFDVNVTGTILVTKAFLDDLKATRGQIINIASDVGRRPVATMSVYVAAKHAIVGFSHSLLRDVRQDGVRVTVVLPGSMQTHFNDSTTPGARPDPDAMTPEDAARTILFVIDTPPGLIVDEVQFRSLRQKL